jgi:large subunit ribosomal protein L18e
MPRPTGPTNPNLKNLIQEIRSKGYKENVKFLIKLADLLERPERKKAEVSLTKINRVSSEHETILIPGKVLDGILEKKLTIAAFRFSEKALKNIHKVKSKAITINDLIKENPKGKDVRVIV